MRGGTQKHISLVMIALMAAPVVHARPVGQPQRNDLNSFFQNDPQSRDVGGLSQGQHGIFDQFSQQNQVDQFGRPLGNQLFHQNHLILAQMAVADSLGTNGFTPVQIAERIREGVNGLRNAVDQNHPEIASKWSKWLWDRLTDYGLDKKFLQDGQINASDLGRALCIDGEEPTGQYQPYLEKGLAQHNLKVGQTNGYRSYQGNEKGPLASSSGPAKDAPARETTGTDTATLAMNGSGSPARTFRDPVAADNISSLGSMARPPRGSEVGPGGPVPDGFQGCGLQQPFNNFNNNDKDRKQAKKNGDKNPGNGAGGDPQQSSPPQPPSGGGGGSGGSPGELQPVDIAKLGQAPQFRVPGAEPDGFDYLKQIKQYGQFDSQWNFGSTIQGMEQGSQKYIQGLGAMLQQGFVVPNSQGVVPSTPLNAERLTNFGKKPRSSTRQLSLGSSFKK